MAAMANLPVFMRLGSGNEHQIGSIDLDVDGEGWLTFDRASLAAALRQLADEVDRPGQSEEVGGGAP